ncbi:YjbH domain-containing protein [Streptomyces sp. SID11385]|uniref:YjbH domain-containing protein n=1 Tax=Streptomyces sp. SID11385 TaxID=2706031 RepID=UPI0013C5CBB3|nr:YjbH domain-containing protein [Streptomyces sp. SID11385]NEA40913.1 YjbH domain-containing protein [Streptomyces sp. SID11385]
MAGSAPERSWWRWITGVTPSEDLVPGPSLADLYRWAVAERDRLIEENAGLRARLAERDGDVAALEAEARTRHEQMKDLVAELHAATPPQSHINFLTWKDS